MEIFAYNPALHISKTNFKGSAATNTSRTSNESIEKIKSQLPDFRLYADCDDFSVPYSKREKMINEYYEKMRPAFFDESGKLKKEAIDLFEGLTFDVKEGNTTTQKTIRQIVNDSVVEKEKLKGTFFHATDYRELGEKIIKEGFDVDKISRTKYGPGIYFSPSEGGSLMYSSCVLKADLDGNCATLNAPFYEKLTDYSSFNKIRNMLGLNLSGLNTRIAEEKIIQKAMNEYTRHIFTDELGCDIAFCSDGVFNTCAVVFDTKAISNIHFTRTR